MKKSILFFFSVIATITSFAQQNEQCATMQVYNAQMQDPVTAMNIRAAQSSARAWLNAHPAQARMMSAPTITVPVVVHVVYLNAAQNISDQQIYSQIDVLNHDYRRLNADTVNTPAVFDSIAADIGVEFCLASIDPQGNPTNGITRTASTGGAFGSFFNPISEDVKSAASGGCDPWPCDKYLNIWVCNLFPGLLGYSSFPGGPANLDGVAITYTAFGNMGTVTAPSLLGRTATHEIGHWFGLYHIWGDDNDCVTGSDSIPDTPNASGASSSDCQVTRNSCSNEDPYWGAFDPNDMVQNYMDYSHDSCMNMFTLGQKARMMSFLYGDSTRYALFNSTGGCNPLGTQEFTFDKYFSLYPVPAQNEVMISYFGKWNSQMRVEIIDLSGKVVRTQQVDQMSYSLNISDLATGVYSLRFVGDGGVAVKKIVKE